MLAPYRRPPPTPPTPPEPEEVGGRGEDLIILALVFVVGALALASAVVDPTRTTAGSLGGMAILFAVAMLSRELRAAKARRQPSTRKR